MGVNLTLQYLDFRIIKFETSCVEFKFNNFKVVVMTIVTIFFTRKKL